MTKTSIHMPTQTPTAPHMPTCHMPTWLALLLTLAMVVLVREGCLWVCVQLGMAQAANIVGLVVLFLLLMGWRVWRGFAGGLPTWLTTASSLLLMDSGFAFLPVSAGAGLLMFGLGDELVGFVLVIVLSTLLPLWGLGKLSQVWLADSLPDNQNPNNQNGLN